MAPKRPPVLISVLAPRLLKWMSKSNAAIYRATDGTVGGHTPNVVSEPVRES
jgi:hypothetical protein